MSGIGKLFQALKMNSGPLKLIFKRIPVSFAFVMVLISVMGALIKSIQQGDPTIFLIEFGHRTLLADLGLRASISTLQAGGLEQGARIFLFMKSISDVLVLYYMIKVLSKILMQIMGRGSSFFGALLVSFGFIGTLEFAVAILLTGEVVIPFIGIYMFISNIHLFFDPILNWINNVQSTMAYLDYNNYTIVDTMFNDGINWSDAKEFTNQGSLPDYSWNSSNSSLNS